MPDKEYQDKKRECWENFKFARRPLNTDKKVFDYIFDRAYALGGEKEIITQGKIEKAAREYVLTRQQARHNAKKEEDATMRDFDKTIKAWDAYDMEQAFESGAILFFGKQEKDADTVIQGWLVRDKDGTLNLFYGSDKPIKRGQDEYWSVVAGAVFEYLPIEMFPDLTWDSEPEEVELIIKRKKYG